MLDSQTQQLGFDLINLVHDIVNSTDTTIVMLEQSIQVVSTVLTLFNSTIQDANTINIIMKTTQLLVQDAATSIQTIENLAHITNKLSLILPSDQTQLLNTFSSSLITSVSKFSLPGAPEINIDTTTLKIQVKTDPLTNPRLTVNSSGECANLRSGFELSSTFYQTVLFNVNAFEDQVQYQYTKFKKNIHNEEIVYSDVVQLKIFGSSGGSSTMKEISVKKLPLPDKVLLYIPLNKPIPSEKQLMCGYWSPTTNAWDTEGCSYVGVMDYSCNNKPGQTVKCLCNYLNDFAIIAIDQLSHVQSKNESIPSAVLLCSLIYAIAVFFTYFLKRESTDSPSTVIKSTAWSLNWFVSPLFYSQSFEYTFNIPTYVRLIIGYIHLISYMMFSVLLCFSFYKKNLPTVGSTILMGLLSFVLVETLMLLNHILLIKHYFFQTRKNSTLLHKKYCMLPVSYNFTIAVICCIVTGWYGFKIDDQLVEYVVGMMVVCLLLSLITAVVHKNIIMFWFKPMHKNEYPIAETEMPVTRQI